jgi:hypothetical protein
MGAGWSFPAVPEVVHVSSTIVAAAALGAAYCSARRQEGWRSVAFGLCEHGAARADLARAISRYPLEPCIVNDALGGLVRASAARSLHVAVDAGSALVACEQLQRDLERGPPVLGIDVEHHSHASYWGFVCLVQVSSVSTNVLFDCTVPAVRDVLPRGLAALLHSSRVLKVLHSCANDGRWLVTNFGVCLHPPVFDTQEAARCLGAPNTALSTLLRENLSLDMDKKWQLADWRQRPLPGEMLAYAIEDSSQLLPLAFTLFQRLKEKEKHTAKSKAGRIRGMEACLLRSAVTAVPGLSTSSAELKGLLSSAKPWEVVASAALAASKIELLFRPVRAELEALLRRFSLPTQAHLRLAASLLVWRERTSRALDLSPSLIATIDSAALAVELALGGDFPSAASALVNRAAADSSDVPCTLEAELHQRAELLAAVLKVRQEDLSADRCGMLVADALQVLSRGTGDVSELCGGEEDMEALLRGSARATERSLVKVERGARAMPKRRVALYDNIELRDVDGTILAKVSRRKAKWYLERGLAYVWLTPGERVALEAIARGSDLAAQALLDSGLREALPVSVFPEPDPEHSVVPDGETGLPGTVDVEEFFGSDLLGAVCESLQKLCPEQTPAKYPIRMRLRRAARGRGMQGDEFHLEDKENVCVVCGTAEELTRLYVVPKLFRLGMPDACKNHTSHDVVLACGRCHVMADQGLSAFSREWLTDALVCSSRGSIARFLPIARANLKRYPVLASETPGKTPVDELLSSLELLAEHQGYRASSRALLEVMESVVDTTRDYEAVLRRGAPFSSCAVSLGDLSRRIVRAAISNVATSLRAASSIAMHHPDSEHAAAARALIDQVWVPFCAFRRIGASKVHDLSAVTRHGLRPLGDWIAQAIEEGSVDAASLSAAVDAFQRPSGESTPVCLDATQVERELRQWDLPWVDDTDARGSIEGAASEELSEGVKGSIEAFLMDEYSLGGHGHRLVRLIIDGPAIACGLERFSAWLARALSAPGGAEMQPSGLSLGGEWRLTEFVKSFRVEFLRCSRPTHLLQNWSVDYTVFHDRAPHHFLADEHD